MSSFKKPKHARAFVGHCVLLLFGSAFGSASCSVSSQGAVKGTSQSLESGESLLQSTVDFRSDGLVTDRSMTNGATVVSGQTYTLSPAGRATREDRVGAVPSQQHYQTDSLGRLACVVSDPSTSCPSDPSTSLPASVRASALYSGDKLTNLRRRTPAGGIANTRLEYDSSARNRPVHLIVSKGDCADASCETSFALAYDPRGNRISEIPSSGQGADVESRRFTYGPDNRLRMLRVASPEAPDSDCSPTRWDQVDTDVGYDHAGMLAFRRRRIGMTTQQVVKYSRTPAGQIGYSLQASGSTGTNRVTYKYLHLSGERVLAVRETWEGTERTSRKYLFLHTDRNGAPVAAFVNDHSEGEGAQQWSADRDPWGWTKITSAFPADEIPFEFPGQLRLDGTEVKRLVVGSDGCQAEVIQPAIVNNGYRDYDPVAGIYLSRDPIALAGSGWSQSWTNRNLYAYAGFSPVDHFDYWGLETPGSSDNATFFKSLIPIYGPAMGMGDAIVQGDWSMAVMNAGFLVLDVASLGTMAVVRDVGTGAIRGLLSAEARTAERAALTEGVEIVEAASKCEAATRGGNILANKAAGDAFRDEIADALKASGRDVEKEVVKQTPFGRRVIDVEVSQGGKVLGGVETKVGESRYLPSQRAKDEWLRQQGYPVNVVRDR